MKIYDCFSYWDEDLLLDLRLNHLRLNSSNPFGRDYDSRLSDIAERIPDVDADNALKEGRVVLI